MTLNDVVQSPFVSDLIRNKARKLMRLGKYSRSDEEDLQQEFLWRLLRAWPRFDPKQGNERAFTFTVIVRAEAFLLRGRQRQLRRDQAVWQASLQRLIEKTEESDRGPSSDQREDVVTICNTLPPDQRDLTKRLGLARPARVARDLKLPRSTLQRRIAKLRTPFRNLQPEEFG